MGRTNIREVRESMALLGYRDKQLEKALTERENEI